jgi:hypothetical protein
MVLVLVGAWCVTHSASAVPKYFSATARLKTCHEFVTRAESRRVRFSIVSKLREIGQLD